MKDLFKGYNHNRNINYSDIWDNAIFIFDTNVLLNLYRYKKDTRNALIEVMSNLNDKVWIPFHVCLEYNRNRHVVIASQNSTYSEVKKIVTESHQQLTNKLKTLNLDKRHTNIDVTDFLDLFSKNCSEFKDMLDNLEEEKIPLTGYDDIYNKLSEIFNDKRSGEEPKEQATVDSWNKLAKIRYENLIPPGYKDQIKDKNEASIFSHGKINYHKKYGDFIVWMQIIDLCEKNTDINNVIFVTDDNKEDWWHIVNSNGKKTIGPRPELIHEITTVSSVNNFLMYNTEKFLEKSIIYLDSKIENNVIQDVKEVADVSEVTNISEVPNENYSNTFYFESYLEKSFDSYTYEFIPDYVAIKDGKKFAFELIKDDSGIVFNDDLLIKRFNSCKNFISGFECVIFAFQYNTSQTKNEAFQYLSHSDLSIFAGCVNYIMVYSIDEDISTSNLFIKIS